MPFSPGDKFDRYVISAVLGRGGMGEVYRAQDTRLQRSVALKIMRPDGEGSQGSFGTEGAARLLREARAVAAMDHPNAVAIFDVGDHDGVPFLAMEFISGRTLRQYVGDPAVPLERRIRWLVDVARALGAAHRRGLVHRDVKPENVMIRDDGVVKVLDFGIARSVAAPVDPTGATEAAALETLTAKGIVVGTPLYMAPEHMRGERIDGRADQFSWGVVAYELLTGSLPWTPGGTALQLVSQILSKDPEPPRARNPEIPSEVDACILHALAKSPAERFETMEHAIAMIDAFAGPSTSLPAPMVSLRPRPPERFSSTKTQLASPASTPGAEPRKWRRAAVGAAAACVAALAVALFARQRQESAPPTESAAADASKAATSARVAWTDSGSQASTNAEAQSAYAAGLQAFRDASADRARSNLERATTLDPTFAAAHLRAALAAERFDTPTRAHVQKAIQLRQSLSDHDRALLDAIEPWTRVPADLEESQRRLTATLAKAPDDADAAFLLGVTRYRMRDHARAIQALDSALALDATFAAAYRMKAIASLDAGDGAAATKANDDCLRVSPAATWCIEDRYDLESREGKCEDAELLARRLIGIDPASPRSYRRLASALYARGQPIDSARMALEQAWQREAPARKALVQLADEARLDEARGDFASADARLAKWQSEVATSPDEWDHAEPSAARMLLALETGKNADAAKLADDYTRRRAAWTPDDFREDPAIYALQARYRSGAIKRDTMAKERDAWLARDADRTKRIGQLAGEGRGRAWTLAYAEMAVTPADATEALDALPRFEPLPGAPARSDASDDAVGATYVLAGRAKEGLPFLERAGASCLALDDAIAHAHATLHLGMAREALGDTDGACKAYAVIAARWTEAKPRSATLDAARARIRALKCAP